MEVCTYYIFLLLAYNSNCWTGVAMEWNGGMELNGECM